MTANQINYLKYLEDVRTHVANENENYRYHLKAEEQRNQEIAVGFMNAQSAAVSAGAAATNANANMLNAYTNQANVSLAQQRVTEEQRHNMAMENIEARNMWNNTWGTATRVASAIGSMLLLV